MNRITVYVHNSGFYGTIAGLLLLLAVPAAQAQTMTVLHYFAGGADGGGPQGLVAVDRAGNVYGSATGGGIHNDGTAYRASNKNGAWIFTPLYQFQGGNDGSEPFAGVTLGPDGNLYGTTLYGGGMGCSPPASGCGTVFKLTPPASICHMAVCPWTETVLYRRSAYTDPCCFFGGVAVDSSGNIYGMSEGGGNFQLGSVYKLTPSGEGNYTLDVIYSFTGQDDGEFPYGTLTVDAAGNLYGSVTDGGAHGYGTIFKLASSGGQYTFQLLYTFTGESDGGLPQGNVVLDSAGNLYGSTTYNGGVFELTPSGGSWTYTLIVPFVDGLASPLSLDAAGNIYGTTYAGGTNDDGSVFELTYSQGTWTNNILYSFTNNSGALPLSSVAFDASGNLYGTTTTSGRGGQGTLWKLTPSGFY